MANFTDMNRGTSKHSISAANHDPSECPKVVLARAEVGKVELCSCGMVLLHAGPVTLRLTVGAFQELNELVAKAVVEGAALQAERDMRARYREVPQA